MMILTRMRRFIRRSLLRRTRLRSLMGMRMIWRRSWRIWKRKSLTPSWLPITVKIDSAWSQTRPSTRNCLSKNTPNHQYQHKASLKPKPQSNPHQISSTHQTADRTTPRNNSKSKRKSTKWQLRLRIWLMSTTRIRIWRLLSRSLLRILRMARFSITLKGRGVASSSSKAVSREM